MRLVASLENVSEHPLAAAIVGGARERQIALAEVTDFESVTGKGVVGTVDGHRVAIGNAKHLEALSIDTGALRDRADELRRSGQTIMFVAVDGTPAGLVGVADPIKPSTPEAIRALHAEGVRVVMLTGDNRTTADAVAKSVGIDHVEADVLPEQKARSSESCNSAESASPWPAMASTTRLRSRRPTSASRWERVRTWRWRAPA